MSKVINVLLFIVVIGLGYVAWEGWQLLQHSKQETAALQLQVDALNQQIRAMQADVNALNQKVSSLDESSVDNIVRQANNAIIDGWQSLVTTVENELERAKEALRDRSQPAEPAPPAAHPDHVPGPMMWPDDSE